MYAMQDFFDRAPACESKGVARNTVQSFAHRLLNVMCHPIFLPIVGCWRKPPQSGSSYSVYRDSEQQEYDVPFALNACNEIMEARSRTRLSRKFPGSTLSSGPHRWRRSGGVDGGVGPLGLTVVPHLSDLHMELGGHQERHSHSHPRDFDYTYILVISISDGQDEHQIDQRRFFAERLIILL